jgi:hypothetical protein
MRHATTLWAVLALVACDGSDGPASSAGGAAGNAGLAGSAGSSGAGTGGTGAGGSGTGGASGSSGSGGAGTGGAAGSVSTGPCTQVLSGGADLATIANAAAPGDVICLRAGNYAGFTLTRGGTASAPLVIKAHPGEERQARLTHESSTTGYGIRIENADYVILEALWIDKVNQGIYIRDSNYVQAWNNLVTEVGQECMRFKLSDFGAFVGNTIRGCGRKAGANGEGIYVGSGESPGDDTHGVLVRGNDISDTTHEGIELKGFTYDCIVEHNVVHDLTVADGGAIHVGTTEAGADNESGHIVRGNIVFNTKTTTVYSDGNGINFHRGGMVYNNVLYDNQHFGIRIDDKKGLKGVVKVFHNTMLGNGSGALGIFDGAAPDVRNNLGPTTVDNLAASADLFVQASAGDFHLKPGSAAIDKGSDVGVSTDLEGTARPQGAGFDYGAYER